MLAWRREGESMSDSPLEPRGPHDEVNGGDEVPTRVCPHCATVSHTAGEYCPQCGKSYSKKGRLSKRARIALIAGLVIVLLGGAGAAIAIKNHQDEETRKKHQAAVTAARVQKERSEQAHRETEDEQKTKRESEERERRSVEKELEKAVEADAKKLVNEGTLTETILGASCNPASGGSSTELNSSTGTYNCIAITKREGSGESSGYRFTGNIDFAKGNFTYHLGGP
jgi:hypothetical protein